jgi:hypothetical protein
MDMHTPSSDTSRQSVSDPSHDVRDPRGTIDDEWFTPEEQDAIILAVARGGREWEREALIAESDRLLHWAQKVRIQGHVLHLVLDGVVGVAFDPDGLPLLRDRALIGCNARRAVSLARMKEQVGARHPRSPPLLGEPTAAPCRTSRHN